MDEDIEGDVGSLDVTALEEIREEHDLAEAVHQDLVDFADAHSRCRCGY